ncbi:hypothetical protein [Mediterraneibacter gnavus]|uniref:hypothetical protein n=1 Tax=Mediterraneibacter gnavus TaxID=33038 RepID=UPI0032B730EC
MKQTKTKTSQEEVLAELFAEAELQAPSGRRKTGMPGWNRKRRNRLKRNAGVFGGI